MDQPPDGFTGYSELQIHFIMHGIIHDGIRYGRNIDRQGALALLNQPPELLQEEQGRLVQFEGYDGGLSPAQWMALRFFSRANSFSCTPSAFAEFQATTRGTATQAIKALEAGGYLVRQRSRADRRSFTLRLNEKGKKALARDPFEVLVRAVDALDVEEQTAMHEPCTRC